MNSSTQLTQLIFRISCYIIESFWMLGFFFWNKFGLEIPVQHVLCKLEERIQWSNSSDSNVNVFFDSQLKQMPNHQFRPFLLPWEKLQLPATRTSRDAKVNCQIVCCCRLLYDVLMDSAICMLKVSVIEMSTYSQAPLRMVDARHPKINQKYYNYSHWHLR